jgi:hypothetical protein
MIAPTSSLRHKGSRPTQQLMWRITGLRDTKWNTFATKNNWTNTPPEQCKWQISKTVFGWDRTHELTTTTRYIQPRREIRKPLETLSTQSKNTLKRLRWGKCLQQTENVAENHDSVSLNSSLSTPWQKLIDTRAVANSWKDIMHGQWKWMTKVPQRYSPVRKTMQRWGFWTNSWHPGCHQDSKDEENLFKCTHQRCKDICLEDTQVQPHGVRICKTEPLLRNKIIEKVQQHTW